MIIAKAGLWNTSTVSYGPSLFSLIYGLSATRLGHKSTKQSTSTDQVINEVSKIIIISLSLIWGQVATFKFREGRRGECAPNTVTYHSIGTNWEIIQNQWRPLNCLSIFRVNEISNVLVATVSRCWSLSSNIQRIRLETLLLRPVGSKPKTPEIIYETLRKLSWGN